MLVKSGQQAAGARRMFERGRLRKSLAVASVVALAGLGYSSTVNGASAATADATKYTVSTAVMNDGFDRTLNAGLGSALQGGAYDIVEGGFYVSNSQAVAVPLDAGKSALALLPSVNVADVAVTTTLSVPTVRSGVNGLWDGVQLRYQADSSHYRAKVAVLDNGKVDLGISRVSSTKAETFLGSLSTPIVLKSGQKLRYEARVTGTSPISIALRAWVYGTATPAWQLVVADSSATRITAGGALGLWTYASSAATAPLAFSYTDWTAKKLVAPAVAPTTTAKPTTTTAKPTTTTAPPGIPPGDLRAIINGSTSSKIQLAAGTFTFNDFQSNAWGVELKGKSLNGAGQERTFIRMNPRTSTKAGMVPTAAFSTNQLSLMMVTGSPTISNFTLAADDQGHLYNGLRVSQTTGAKVSNVTVVAIPGNSNSPPGETFAINDYRSSGNVYSNIVIDGGNNSAAGFGVNGSSNLTINGLRSVNNKYSSAITFWKTNNATLNDFVADNNHKSINFEQNTGTFNIVRPKFGSSAVGFDLSVFSNISSNKVIISDPILAPGQKIRIRPYIGAVAYNGVNKQVRSDIVVRVNGVDKTNELVQWM